MPPLPELTRPPQCGGVVNLGTGVRGFRRCILPPGHHGQHAATIIPDPSQQADRTYITALTSLDQVVTPVAISDIQDRADTFFIAELRDEDHGTCDWGGCMTVASNTRWSPELREWLPVCPHHATTL